MQTPDSLARVMFAMSDTRPSQWRTRHIAGKRVSGDTWMSPDRARACRAPSTVGLEITIAHCCPPGFSVLYLWFIFWWIAARAAS
jgi:hypothetical protein